MASSKENLGPSGFGGKSHRAGVFVRQSTGYRAFIPKPLPPSPSLAVDEAMQTRLANAERNLGRLDSVSLLLPDPNRFVGMYVRQEAILSSQIEGTQTSLYELLEFEAEENEAERPVDIGEVINHVKALAFGIERLAELPVSARLLCEVHRVLTTGVRGGEPALSPGEFRRSQNWIGGTNPTNARFVPPPVPEMKEAFSALEKFLHTPKDMPLLFEIGLAHAQFETIHPFVDGNGRIGRLLITFLLTAREALSKPLLYLSHFFKAHRDEYYDRLQRVRTDGDWEGWLSFFLDAVGAVAGEATQKARRIISICEEDKTKIRSELKQRSGTALDLLDYLIERPVVTSRLVQKQLGRSQPTVDKLLTDLTEIGVLQPVHPKRWGRRYAYARYLSLFQD